MSPGPSIVQSGEKPVRKLPVSQKKKQRSQESEEGLTNYIMPLRDERSYGLATGFGKARSFTKVASLVWKVTQAYLSEV